MDNNRIIQIILCVKPIIAVYDITGDSDHYWFSWIYHIGLTEDGSIVPIDIFDGCLVNAEDVRNFCGVYYGLDYVEDVNMREQMKRWLETEGKNNAN